MMLVLETPLCTSRPIPEESTDSRIACRFAVAKETQVGPWSSATSSLVWFLGVSRSK